MERNNRDNNSTKNSEEHRSESRAYRGPPEKQRNPRALNAHVPKPKAQVQTRKPRLAESRPPARFLATEPFDQPMVRGSPFDDAIFAQSASGRERTRDTQFLSTYAVLPELTRATYDQLCVDNPNLNRILTPEYVNYYDVACLWLRIAHLKSKLGQIPSDEEAQAIDLTENKVFTVLEPQRLFFQGTGKTVSRGGEHLKPTLPVMPKAKIGNFGGYYGPVTDESHLLYEEVPCLGVAAEAVRQSVSDARPGPYASSLATGGNVANSNLLGFYPLRNRRPEAKDIAFAQGISTNSFPETISLTGFNLPFIEAISDTLAQTKTFKVTSVNFALMAEHGTPNQLIISKTMQDDSQRCVLANTQCTSLNEETRGAWGCAVTFDYQLFKEPGPGDDHSTWYVFNAKQGNEPYPPARIANRNDRRNIPVQYLVPTFLAQTQQAREFRAGFIKTLVLTPR